MYHSVLIKMGGISIARTIFKSIVLYSEEYNLISEINQQDNSKKLCLNFTIHPLLTKFNVKLLLIILMKLV